MTAISVGRVVTKIMGREAGRRAIVTQLIDRNFVEITGPEEFTGVKRRRVNIDHIEPSTYLLEIEKGEDDNKILSVIEDHPEIKEYMSKKIS